MSSIKGAPIINNGYYDIPINNQFSSTENRNIPIESTDYNINKKINTTINNNMGEYIVHDRPTHPSPSLYIESDKEMTPYYQDKHFLSYDSNVPLLKKKEMIPYAMENFHNIPNNYLGDDYDYTNYEYIQMNKQLEYTVEQPIQPRPIIIQNTKNIEIENPIILNDIKNEDNIKRKKTKKIKLEEKCNNNNILWMVIIILSIIILFLIYTVLQCKKIIKF